MTTIFLIETLLKMIAFGFMTNGRNSYLRSPWNLLDFTVVLLSMISLTPISEGLSMFKMFRILRVLRLIGRNESLRVGVQALLYAIPNIFNVTVIMLFFFLIFGILFVSYFKGKFYKCSHDHISLVDFSEIQHKWDCLNLGA